MNNQNIPRPRTGQREQLAEILTSNLQHFTGTETYTRLTYPWLETNLLLTDGAKYLAETAGAFWLMDAIVFHQITPKVSCEPFQVWKLTVSESGKSVLACTDGNENTLTNMVIDYTNFPLPEITLYAEQSDYLGGRVVMLTSEY